MSQKRKPSNSKTPGYKKKQHGKARRQNQLWKWIGLGFAAVVIIIAAILLIPKISGDAHISVAQAYQKYQQGAFFLDVRSQEEWDQVHIANSTLIPLDELPNKLSELPNDRDIVVVCLSGHRSEQGVTMLRNAGFSQATCMTDGLTAWKAAGYPLEGSNP
ncbi:MAG: rhodanese-like domain-containing protein [Anaerolineales bacterium]